MNKNQIMNCCKDGYDLGFRTFVLQGGEDGYYTDEILVEIVREIKNTYPDCAITLSIGERSYESYKRLFVAGADRYLLRHETANDEHYKTLHPFGMSPVSRKECLLNLKEIGYQVGCGFMVGSPGQTLDHIVDDLLFIKELNPHMVGIGPFIPHYNTPFGENAAGDLRLTLNILAVLRIMQPNLLIPSTTALETLDRSGRELGILAGANVVMLNISPTDAREKYSLYNNKVCANDEAAECREHTQRRIESIGYEIIESRGDYVAI